ncbi:hypothetical protein [Paragemmobacter ruber]|uniref:Uncharacterized protein n=1 Tax=Paragemmobacter ruber TaxID=1985673 RepID=A0ABW9Y490_9RHOB|nr:hypothetical protein [Rhodobacter ruber]NBE06941.1 hypothetical protein [Rhodobacter ruber]
MGPVRGRLIAALALLAASMLAGPARAGVCADLRPDWVAGEGTFGALAEAGYVLGSPIGMILLALVGLALIWPRRWLAVVVALPVLGLAGLLFLSRQAETAAQAMAEGCIGGIGPTVVFLVLLAAAVLVRGFRPRRRAA